MSYPITPDASIHQLPPAVAAQQTQQTTTQIEASASNLLTAIVNSVLSLLTGGLLGTGATSSQDAFSFFSNLFTNFFNMLGIGDPAALLATVETDVFNSVAAIENFIINVLAPTGLLSLGSDVENFLSGIWSALTGTPGTGKSAADVASALAVLASQITDHGTTLAVRDNQSTFLGNGPTEEVTFPYSSITGGSPLYLSLTPTNAVTGFIRIGQTVNKDAVTWLGQDTTGLTGFYVSVYKMDTTTGDMSLVYESPNQLTSVSTLLSWNTYVIPAGSEIATSTGDVFAIELSVTGTGTYQVVGIDMSWAPDHPTNFPKQLGASRNNANSGVAPSAIASGNVIYSTDIPFIGFGVDAGNGFHAPATTSFDTAGTGTYAIPDWAKYVDIILMGGGGAGSGGGVFNFNGIGGTGGAWSAVTAQIGVDIPLTTTAISFTVGAGGTGSGGYGTNGGDTTATATGWTGGLTATGGAGGAGAGFETPTSSYGADNETFAGQTYYGGGIQNSGLPGISPGGGGGGGTGTNFAGYPGGNGANGVAWFVARAS